MRDRHGLKSGRIVDYGIKNQSRQILEDAISVSMTFLRRRKCDRITMFRPTEADLRRVTGKFGFATAFESLTYQRRKFRLKFNPYLVVKPLRAAHSSAGILDSAMWSPTLLYHDVL